MIRKILFIVITVCLFVPSHLFAQSRDIKKAYEEFNAGHYHSAAGMLRKAYSSAKNDEDRADIMFKIGECYRNITDPKQAELWYRKAIDKGYKDPIVFLYIAEARKMNEKWAEAREDFRRYKERVPGDRRADDGIRSCDFAIHAMENSTGYIVESMKVWNTRQDDFSPVFASEDFSTVYFTSSRDAATGKNINAVTGQKFADIFVSKKDRKGAWSQPVPIEGDVNTEFDEGMCSFSADFKTMYFTRCRSSANKAWGCQIVTAKLVNGKWTNEKAIDIANDTVVIAHPAISPDELTLYFVSDMPGGQGGKDIWKVTRATVNDNWGRPENLGPTINTTNDEMFPYVHPDGTLYFSSNGHVGLGGLDIFKATEENGKWTVENMGNPINSPADDFGITFEADTETGFFSSNRKTMRGDDDIWKFSLPPLSFRLVGLVKDEKTERPIPDATVQIISTDGINNQMQTGTDGTFSISLKAGHDYVFLASKQSYLNGRERESTRGYDRSRDFRIEIPLTSIARPIEIPNIFYDFARWELRPESMVSLDNLVQLLNDNPNITIEIGSHTDARGSEAANIELSQRRAQSVVNYLIEKGIASDRLTSRGFGKSTPKVVDDQMAGMYDFLRNGATLNEAYIGSLPTTSDEQEIAHQLNRRTDFRVIRTDYR